MEDKDCQALEFEEKEKPNHPAPQGFYGLRLEEANRIPLQCLAARLKHDIDSDFEANSIAETTKYWEFLLVKTTILAERTIRTYRKGSLISNHAFRIIQEVSSGFGHNLLMLGERIESILCDARGLCEEILEKHPLAN